MEILIADPFPAEHAAILADRGHEVRVEPDLTEHDLAAALRDAEVLVVRSTRVPGETLAAGSALVAVIRAGAGTNTIAVDAATALGIAVCNVPGKNAVAVAELTLGLVLALDRFIPDAVADLRDGRWRKAHYAQAQGLKGRAFGVVGLGAVGQAVAERAAAFEVALFGIAKPDRDPAVVAACRRLGMVLLPTLADLAERCTILSFHVPSTAETRGIIGPAVLDRVPEGALIINTSRGDLVDTEALLDAMDRKGVRAALDVFDGEPAAGAAEFAHPLVRHPNVYGTHHIGASTHQAQRAVADEVVALVDELADGRVRSCVNPPVLSARAGRRPATRT